MSMMASGSGFGTMPAGAFGPMPGAFGMMPVAPMAPVQMSNGGPVATPIKGMLAPIDAVTVVV